MSGLSAALTLLGAAETRVEGDSLIVPLSVDVPVLGADIAFAPAVKSGLTRRLQTAITESLDEGELVAVRSRPYGASLRDGLLRAKEAGDEVLKSFANVFAS